VSSASSPASPELDTGIQGLTYSGGCQPPCCALPLSSCIYLAFTMTSVRGACPAAAIGRAPSSSSKRLKPGSRLNAR